MPRVSIVIPTYNRADLLPLTLQSALKQTYLDTEIIVVDNASTDDTPALMKQYEDRVRYIRNPQNMGMAYSYNLGRFESQGEFIHFLDSDDLLAPGKIAAQVKYLDLHPYVDLVRTGGYYIDLIGSRLGRVRLAPCGKGHELLSRLVLGNFDLFGSIVFRRSCLDRVGTFNENLSNYTDWDLSIRLAAAGCYFGFIPDPLFYYRFHSGNSMKNMDRVAESTSIILEKTFSLTSSSLPPNIQIERDIAYAMAHAFLAFGFFASSRPGDAGRHFVQAWQSSLEWRKDPRRLLDTLFSFALYMYVDDVVHLAHTTFDNLPVELSDLHTYSSKWVALMHLLKAFRSYDCGDIHTATLEVQNAIRLYPQLLTDRSDFILFLSRYALQAVSDPLPEFVDRVLAHLPDPAQHLRNTKNDVLARINLAKAYADQAANPRSAARLLFNAIRLSPQVAGNAGVLPSLARNMLSATMMPRKSGVSPTLIPGEVI